MSELSYILNSATGRSLVILDEIGRGTSTYDGLSIAWSAAEYLSRPERRIRTLFATHYHEMTVLEDSIRGVRNLNVDVTEENGEEVFLHKIVEGKASRSYGIHVARIAGAPMELIERAQIHLDALSEDMKENREVLTERAAPSKESEPGEQLSLFAQVPDPVSERIKSLDLMNTTPSEALKILEELQKHLS